ncbi:uncharacterized protein LOC135280657 isoform X3 [Passer domesticus]|uniref:uncharacterized protein LOC135280657 isoform X3 n=1 Tax=Passer domesticus TaxID=48849 RepID=UPI0030FE14B1
MSAPPGICSSLHLKHSTKFHPLLLQQVLVTQFLLTAEEEAQVSSENEQLEGWGHELGLEEETSMWRCDCSVNTVPGANPYFLIFPPLFLFSHQEDRTELKRRNCII